MNKAQVLTHVFLVIFGAFFIQSKSWSEPANLGQLKTQVKQYHDSGEYAHDLASVASSASAYIQHYAKRNANLTTPKKLAIVLDIDETSLSNYAFMLAHDFAATPQILKLENSYGKATAIAPILSLYQQALHNNVSVFFITGRPIIYKQVTENNLKQAGYTHWNAIYFSPSKPAKQSTLLFKENSRCDIEMHGYQVIASIGDQWSDLKGRCVEKGFKLPNVYYFIP